MKQYLSVDAETDGLWGNPFSIGAILYDESGTELDSFYGSLPKSFIKNEWVIENVLPQLPNEYTHSSLDELLEDFSKFYNKYNSATTIWHMGHVVESNLFRLLVEKKYIGEWNAPYTPIEVSTLLLLFGENPSSVDEYVKKYNLKLSKSYLTTHNPLYDCEVTAKVYFDLINKNN